MHGTKSITLLVWPDPTAVPRRPEPLTVCRPCCGCFPTHTASPLSEAPATLNSCHGRRFLCEQILQETQSAVYRIMGCSWLRPRLALGANTDIHTERSGLCSSAMGSGAMPGRPTSRFSLSGAGTLPAPRRKKTKAFRSRLGGKPASLLWSPPKDSACCAPLRRPLCLPPQIRGQPGFGRWCLRVLETV